MREPITLALGEHSYRIRPLTAAQVEAISSLVNTTNRPPVSVALDVIDVALSRDHAQTKVRDLEVDGAGITAGYNAVLLHCGFETKGEAPAAAPTTQASGERSEAA